MFNLIMRSVEWNTGRETMLLDRMFEYTEDDVKEQFKQDGVPMWDRLIRLPCLFMQEGIEEKLAYVGQINRARVIGTEVIFEYTLDADVPSLQNSTIYANRIALDMPHEYEFSRNHWAVKDVDLYRFLLHNISSLQRNSDKLLHS